MVERNVRWLHAVNTKGTCLRQFRRHMLPRLRPRREHRKSPSELAPLSDPILDIKGYCYKGVVLDSGNNDTILVDRPSLGFHTTELESSRVSIDDYQELIKNTEEERDTGLSSSRLELKLSRLQEDINTLIEGNQMAKSFD